MTPALLREVPLDQFTGKPLLYKVVDGRPVVYSVGADLDDDGGQPPGPGYAPMSVAGSDDEQPPDGDWILWPPQKSDEDTPPAKDAEAP